ncbi:hypothetical protein GA0074692_4493 [Micromonospora pallida]|uniref:Uncharacterized protein n=1 Tax=Micromonospora pallida TaxID=145854 RepID=A0A1C6T5T8_9ACTN|nr:hypothetical protein GA0074692_4493 [Micromonospora pallida]
MEPGAPSTDAANIGGKEIVRPARMLAPVADGVNRTTLTRP